ncbi:hypothetical protein FOMPIDRAFT_101590 [Fomitopsis schrenkii]|uniref:mRNA export factor GLE1 n=1 Tax=Fomitopsis schrenkii TaxID=2126942 RepID=S8FC80_FOMSC|nr:hypothetical protein FOMPIDRAFT_101590 [Fomitopsis schrenkii]
MRFSAARTPSPPPLMRLYRSRSTFGVPSDSEDEEEAYYSEVDDDGASDSASSSGESSHSAGQRHARHDEDDEEEEETYLSDDLEEILTLSRPKRERPKRSAAEEHYISEVLASVRLRANHHDPYEEWKADLKEESLRVARHDQSLVKSLRHRVQHATHAHVARLQAEDLAATRARARDYVAAVNTRRDNEMERLRTEWEERNKLLWEHIEGVIGREEDKARAVQEEECKKREEEERVRREAEDKRRKAEEEKRREEEAKRKEKEREEEEERQAAQAERARQERDEAEAEQRKQLGFASANEDWRKARQDLMWLKTGPMKTVKANKELKSLWSAGRRAITPKVGQLTSDQETITRISHEVVAVVLGSPRHPEPVYFALLSSLAKAILLQAETEVTAEKRSAGPLAQVAAHALGALAGFAEAFWAKLVQRAGGWPVPAVVPRADVDGRAFVSADRRKALGFREGEGFSEYTARVTGLMRVYFHVLCTDAAAPLEPVFRLPRLWSYCARMLAEPALLKSSLAPGLLHAALDIGGVKAKQVWGKQWVKLLAQLYEAATVGLEGTPGQLLGGDSSEGIAARVRVQLEIERIVAQ